MDRYIGEALRRKSVEGLISYGNRVGILSDIEQRKLIKKYQKDGDQQALERLIFANIRLVVKEAISFHGLPVPLEDLVMAGVTGMVIAADRFVCDRRKYKGKFITYAIFWVRQQMKTALNYEGQPVRAPLNKVRDVYNLKKRLGSEKAAQVLQDKDLNLYATLSPALSLDRPVNDRDGSGDIMLVDTLQEEGADSLPLSTSVLASSQKIINEVMAACLSEREAKIVTLRFDLARSPEGPLTLTEIGERVGLTRERIRQITLDALGKMRRELARRGIESLELVA